MARLLDTLGVWKRVGPWDLTSLSFSTANRQLKLGSATWTMRFQIIGSRLWGSGRKGAVLQSYVFLTPRSWSPARERAFWRVSWRPQFEALLSGLGYSGSWDRTPW